MVEIGKYNNLKVVKIVEFGVYLDGGNNVEILLPKRYITSPLQVNDIISVFIYTDSEDRLIATTEKPHICVGEFGFLTVKQTTKIGAFMDWGLGKDLFVPFREQRTKMIDGQDYIVYAYLDNNTKRIVASSKIEKYIGNTIPRYDRGESVDVLVYQLTEIGYKVIVNNLHHGMIYHNENFKEIKIGDKIEAYVKGVREDGKIDITLSDKAVNRIGVLSEQIYDWLVKNGGETDICDKSDPDRIKQIFACSKKDFKKAIGLLYKELRIVIGSDGIKLA